MFTNRNLNFPHKAILTSELLKEIYKYPREFLRLFYKDYADGIICGLNYFIDDEKNLILSSGVILANEEFYFLEKNLNISELAEKNNLSDGKDYFIFPQKESRKKSPCLTENELTLTFSEKKENFTLGQFRFKSSNNFNLPKLSEGEDVFEDIFRPSRMNLFDVPFSDKDEATFHPQLFALTKNFLLSKESKTPFDYSILTQLQNNDTISLQTVKAYIYEEIDEDNFEDRQEMFKSFCECLRSSEFKIRYVATDDSPQTHLKPKKNRPYLL